MQVLLLLFLMLPCLPEKWSPAAWAPSPSSSSLLTWAGIGVAVLFAAGIAHRLCRQLRNAPEQRESLLRRYSWFRLVHTLTLCSIYLLGLYLFGWPWAVQIYLGHPDGIAPGAELIILSPFLAGLIGSWACFYDAERAIHLSARAPHDEQSSSRCGYILYQIRQSSPLAFLPVLLFIGIKATCSVLGIRNDELKGLAIGLGGTALYLALIPVIFRYVVGLQPLSDPVLRGRLMSAAQRLNVRCSNILVWKTRGNMANAMVIGILPWLRYIIFTDHLLSNMTTEEVEAVFGHEVGHVKHRHIGFYLFFLMMSTAVVSVVCELVSKLFFGKGSVEASIGEQWWMLAPMLLATGYIFVVFGFISRRCEKQADIYGCRAVSCPDASCQEHADGYFPAPHAQALCPTGIGVFISALEKVASLNGISRDRPGWLLSWSHGTIAHRVEFLSNLRRDPSIESGFQRGVARVKFGLVIGLAVLLVLAGALVGWEALLAMG